MEIIDAYTHVLPRHYFDRVDALLNAGPVNARISGYHRWFKEFPALIDTGARWEAVEGIENYRQVLVLAVPPVEELGSATLAAELSRLANDEMAEMVRSAPDLYVGFAACLPLNDVDASLEELDRAMGDLGALGAQLYTNVSGVALDAPQFAALFARLAELDSAVWLHPTRGEAAADYSSEAQSRFGVWWSLGWPYETSVAMARIVYAGILERHPTLRIITHHGGAMIPQLSKRLAPLAFQDDEPPAGGLSKPIVDYFKMFYADTVLGVPGAVRATVSFFGVDNVLFASDMPFGLPTVVQDMIAGVRNAELPAADNEAIFAGNVNRVLALSH